VSGTPIEMVGASGDTKRWRCPGRFKTAHGLFERGLSLPPPRVAGGVQPFNLHGSDLGSLDMAVSMGFLQFQQVAWK
jgi:hypothetical protein